MLRATRAGRLYTAPTLPPEETEEEEEEEDEEGGPRTLFPEHRGFRVPLEYEEAEEFDIREKVPLDFADVSPQEAGKLRKEVERVLAEKNPHFEIVEEEDD